MSIRKIREGLAGKLSTLRAENRYAQEECRRLRAENGRLRELAKLQEAALKSPAVGYFFERMVRDRDGIADAFQREVEKAVRFVADNRPENGTVRLRISLPPLTIERHVHRMDVHYYARDLPENVPSLSEVVDIRYDKGRPAFRA